MSLKSRLQFALACFVALPVAIWTGFYAASMIYFWVTGRGGPSSAFLMAWGGLIVYATVAILSWKQISRRLK